MLWGGLQDRDAGEIGFIGLPEYSGAELALNKLVCALNGRRADVAHRVLRVGNRLQRKPPQPSCAH